MVLEEQNSEHRRIAAPSAAIPGNEKLIEAANIVRIGINNQRQPITNVSKDVAGQPISTANISNIYGSTPVPLSNIPERLFIRRSDGSLVLFPPGSSSSLITLPATSNGIKSSDSSISLRSARGQSMLNRCVPLPSSIPPLQRATLPLSCAIVPTTVAKVNSNTSTFVDASATNTASKIIRAFAPKTSSSSLLFSTDKSTRGLQKCHLLLQVLIEKSNSGSKNKFLKLIQDLIDAKIECEDFCDRVGKLMNSAPQPAMVSFISTNLVQLRKALYVKELVIPGIRPPAFSTVEFPLSSMPIDQNQNVLNKPVPSPDFQVASNPTTVTPHIKLSAGGANDGKNILESSGTLNKSKVVRPKVASADSITNIFVRNAVKKKRQTKLQNLDVGQKLMQSQQLKQLIDQKKVKIITYKSDVTNATSIAATSSSAIQSTKLINPKTIISAEAVYSSRTALTNAASIPHSAKSSVTQMKEKKLSAKSVEIDNDLNDVAAMGGICINEESQIIFDTAKHIAPRTMPYKAATFLAMSSLQKKINLIASKHNLECQNNGVATIISHALEQRIKSFLEKLSVIAGHRSINPKSNPQYEVTHDVKKQLLFLKDVDRAAERKCEEREVEQLARAAKKWARDNEELRALKIKAKEKYLAQMEEVRRQESNDTALQAIGPRKRIRLDVNGNYSPGFSGCYKFSVPPQPVVRRVNKRDLLFLLEQEYQLRKSTSLYLAYLQ